jgi:hypothetical protein
VVDPRSASGRHTGRPPASGEGDVSGEVLRRLQGAATQLPPSVAPGAVRAIRQGQLVRVITEALAPERQRFEAEQARWRARIDDLERELGALEAERRRLESTQS